MTEQELKRTIEQKGYTYKEETNKRGFVEVLAVKGKEEKFIGMKELLLMDSLEQFMRNKAYLKL